MSKTTTDTPRVWMACLSCYNGGTMHGNWFGGDDTLEAEMAKLFEIKDGLAKCGGEEFVAHDFEGFGDYDLGEVSATQAAKVGAWIEEHGEVGLLALANFHGNFDDAEAAIGEYCGAFDSLAAYAEDFYEQTGDLKSMGDLVRFVDWEAVGREWEMGGDIWTIEKDGEVHIFGNV